MWLVETAHQKLDLFAKQTINKVILCDDITGNQHKCWYSASHECEQSSWHSLLCCGIQHNSTAWYIACLLIFSFGLPFRICLLCSIKPCIYIQNPVCAIWMIYGRLTQQRKHIYSSLLADVVNGIVLGCWFCWSIKPKECGQNTQEKLTCKDIVLQQPSVGLLNPFYIHSSKVT